MKFFDVIILGSGASGCMACMNANKSISIAIIDKSNKLAKKLLSTGNGRCNLTNKNMSSEFFNQNIDEFLAKFNQNKTENFFSKIGLQTYADEGGRIYPFSNSAKSVTSVIETQITNQKNVSVFLEHNILKISKTDKNFVVETDKEIFESSKLVFALGGGNALLKNLNIDVVPCHPSLVSLKIDCPKFLSGVRVSNVKASVKCGEKNKSDFGEILFKDGGISGICVFNCSTLFARNSIKTGKIEIDLLPNMTASDVEKLLIKRKKLNVNVSKFFEGLFVSQIGYEILNRAKLDEEKPCNLITDVEIQKMTSIIKHFDFNVKGFFDNNQVFSGGAKLSSLDSTLQSKQIPNLYFCGEACDVDGECGGYNLQWAWTSGKIVGEAL